MRQAQHYPRGVSEQHYFTSRPTTEAAEHSHVFTIRGRELGVTTASGVFSADRLDKGTQVLLEHVPAPPATGTFLDLGCGWGAIALALACESPRATVLATDVNERALDLTVRNTEAAGCRNVRVMEASELLAELLDKGTRLDLIWSNPPVRIGKEALHRMLSTWLRLLAGDGVAWLVVGKNLGADSLARWLTQQGYEVERTASSKGFRVLQVRPLTA